MTVISKGCNITSLNDDKPYETMAFEKFIDHSSNSTCVNAIHISPTYETFVNINAPSNRKGLSALTFPCQGISIRTSSW